MREKNATHIWIVRKEQFFYIALWNKKINLFSKADIQTVLMS